MNEAVIVEAVRTPFGRRGGWWADKRPDDLLAEVIQACWRAPVCRAARWTM